MDAKATGNGSVRLEEFSRGVKQLEAKLTVRASNGIYREDCIFVRVVQMGLNFEVSDMDIRKG